MIAGWQRNQRILYFATGWEAQDFIGRALEMANELDSLVQEWATAFQIEPPVVEADGRRFVVIDGLYEIALFQLGEQLYLSAPIGALPADRQARQDALDHLLGLQMARAGQGAEVVSIDPDDSGLMLHRTLVARQVTARTFEAALSLFIATLEFWTKQLQRRSFGAEHRAPPAMQIMYP